MRKRQIYFYHLFNRKIIFGTKITVSSLHGTSKNPYFWISIINADRPVTDYSLISEIKIDSYYVKKKNQIQHVLQEILKHSKFVQ